MKESLKQVLKINSDPLAILINTSFEQEDLSKPSVIAVRLKLIVAIYSYLRIFRSYNLAVGIFFSRQHGSQVTYPVLLPQFMKFL